MLYSSKETQFPIINMRQIQYHLPFSSIDSPENLIRGIKPYYSTRLGNAYLSDAIDVLKAVPDNSVNLVITSPPYALHFKKEYGNVSKTEYVEWFLPFAKEIYR